MLGNLKGSLLAWFCVFALVLGMGYMVMEYKKTSSTDSQNESPPTTVGKGNTTIVVKDKWSSCPIKVFGSIQGSSKTESFKLTIANTTSKDIDSVKLMFRFIDNQSGDSEQAVIMTCTLDTIWARESLKTVVAATGYNFLRATIYPICVYFKDGSSWGDSSASTNDIIKNSIAFEVEHYALNMPEL